MVSQPMTSSIHIAGPDVHKVHKRSHHVLDEVALGELPLLDVVRRPRREGELRAVDGQCAHTLLRQTRMGTRILIM